MTHLVKYLGILLFIAVQGFASTITLSNPTVISDDTVDSHCPVTRINSSGHITAIFVQGSAIVSREKPPQEAWTTAVTLSSTDASSPKIAMDSSGNIAALWLEGTTLKIAEKPVGGSWGSASTLASSASSPEIAMSPSGDIIAVWLEASILKTKIKKSGFSWPSTSSTISSAGASNPQVAVGGGNDLYVAWEMDAAGVPSIWISSGDLTTTLWSVESKLSSTNAVNPSLFVGDSGHVIVAWFSYVQPAMVYCRVRVSVRTKMAGSTSWSDETDISNDGCYDPNNLKIYAAVSSNGTLLALWKHSYSGSSFVIESSVKPPMSVKWLPANILATDEGLLDFALFTDYDGMSVLSYMLTDSSIESIKMIATNNESHLRRTWATLAKFTTEMYNSCPHLHASYSPTGNHLCASVVWDSYSGSKRVVRAACANIAFVLPPTNVQVTTNIVDFYTRTERQNVITWTASASSDVRNYVIYRNNHIIGRVGPNVLSFTDRHRVMGEVANYRVTALDSNLLESTPATPS